MQPVTWRKGREDRPRSQVKKRGPTPQRRATGLMIFQDGPEFKNMDAGCAREEAGAVASACGSNAKGLVDIAPAHRHKGYDVEQGE